MDTLFERNRNGQTPAHIAAFHNNSRKMRAIARIAPQSFNIGDKDGDTPAHIATRRGYKDILDIIIKFQPLSLNIINERGMAPAHIAAKESGDVNINIFNIIAKTAPSSLMIQYKFRPKVGAGFAPAHIAAERGHLEILKIIWNYAPHSLYLSFNRDSVLDTPALMVMGRRNGSEIFRFIASNEPNTLRIKNEYGSTPIHTLSEKKLQDTLAKIVVNSKLAKKVAKESNTSAYNKEDDEKE